jgi:hypothetical protein
MGYIADTRGIDETILDHHNEMRYAGKTSEVIRDRYIPGQV